MNAEYLRDAAMTAAIFGFFAMGWFGWAQEAPPKGWKPYLVAGSIVGGLASAGGLATALTHWDDGTALGADGGRTFGIVVGIEFGAAAIGAVALALTGRSRWIPVWVAFVVGVHLFPVAGVFDYAVIGVVGVLITAASLAAVPIARSRDLAPSAVTGAPTGVALASGAVYSLLSALLAY
ncbi:hypothetical protein [Cryptosporangium arvum]|uniref:hypothetical protein n=1 Tax=Cryptosporangium arvum TaxID=80871 RepID=UPI0004B3D8E3|nr:hypothetical protein [Cryptosporangium arvum]